MKQQQLERTILWNRQMTVAEFYVSDRVDAINDELMDRGVDPDQIIAVFQVPGRSDRLDMRPGALAAQFRVLYRA
jgi:hypothetical protein